MSDTLTEVEGIREVLAAHFVMWHETPDSDPPGEWRCACGMKFGFSDGAIDHVAREVRAATTPPALPSWCRCPDDCDCEGVLIPAGRCDEKAGPVSIWCQLPLGHQGSHVGPGSVHRWDRTEDRGAIVVRDHRSARGVTPAEANDVYVVHTPRGFTETFDRRTIDTLERLGLIRHERDGHVLEDGHGNGVGPLHRYYREATR